MTKHRQGGKQSICTWNWTTYHTLTPPFMLGEHLGLHLALANLCITPFVHFHRTCGKFFVGTHFFSIFENIRYITIFMAGYNLYEGKSEKSVNHMTFNHSLGDFQIRKRFYIDLAIQSDQWNTIHPIKLCMPIEMLQNKLSHVFPWQTDLIQGVRITPYLIPYMYAYLYACSKLWILSNYQHNLTQFNDKYYKIYYSYLHMKSRAVCPQARYARMQRHMSMQHRHS